MRPRRPRGDRGIHKAPYAPLKTWCVFKSSPRIVDELGRTVTTPCAPRSSSLPFGRAVRRILRRIKFPGLTPGRGLFHPLSRYLNRDW